MANLEEMARNCQGGTWGSSSEPRPCCRTGDGRGRGSIPGAASLEGSNHPAGTIWKEGNSSCSRMENQMAIEELVLCLRETGKKKRKAGWGMPTR